MSKKSNVIPINSVVTTLALHNLSLQVQKLQQKQKESYETAVKSILYALDLKDHYTYGHSLRVAFFSLLLGRELGLTEEEIYDLEMAALTHDIGKIGVPDSVLLKPSRLTEEEFNLMKSHPEKSAEILNKFPHFEKIAKDVMHHHERFDGRGYPYNLKGEDIPLGSRIILIGDTFDAMTSSRPYRKGLPQEVAFKELHDYSETQFDPHLVKKFISAMKKENSRQEEHFNLTILEGSFKKDAA